MSNKWKDIVQKYLDANLSIIPINDKKQPYNGQTGTPLSWKVYQTSQIVNNGYFHNAHGIALVCGFNNIESIDIDTKHDDTGLLWERLYTKILEELPNIPITIQQSQNEGYHFIYKCEKIEGNQKLARKTKLITLIETRGKGGCLNIHPTPKYSVIHGSLENIQEISIEDRDKLFEICRSFNLYIEESKGKIENKYKDVKYVNLKSPFDDYNQTSDALALLVKHGWELLYQKGNKKFLRRPNSKSKVPHATFDHVPNCLYVFSTNTIFESEKVYNPSAIFCLLECNNNWSECAKKLLDSGYGDRYEYQPHQRVIKGELSIKEKYRDTSIQEEATEKPKIPNFPMHVFPEVYREIIEAVGDAGDIPKEFLAMSIISAISASLGLNYQVKHSNTWKKHSNLYMALVGFSGQGKDPAMDFAFQPFQELERVYEKEYQDKYDKYELNKAMSKKEKSNLTLEDLREPVRREIIVQNITLEGLMKSHKYNPKGLIFTLPELASWFNSFNSYRKGSDVEDYMKMFDNKMVKKGRSTVKGVSIDKPYINICGGIQPGILKNFAKNGLDENGLLFRFIFVFTNKRGFKDYDELCKGGNVEMYEKRYKDLLRPILHQSYKDDTQIVPLSIEAEQIFNKWYNAENIKKTAWEAEAWENPEAVANLSLSSKISQFITKMVLNLQALAYTAGEDDMREISGDSMKNAIELAEYFKKTFKYAMWRIEQSKKDTLDKQAENKAYLQEKVESIREAKTYVDWDRVFGEDKQLQRKELVERILNERLVKTEVTAIRRIDRQLQKSDKYGYYKKPE